MKIDVQVISHEKQRYDTVGDWFWAEGTLNIRVSDLGDWRANAAVSLHEQFEALLCKAWGITEKQVDDFDMSWTEHDVLEEPGDDPASPYHKAHMLAYHPEELFVLESGLPFPDYDAAFDRLPAHPSVAS